jgi:O-antigen ligase
MKIGSKLFGLFAILIVALLLFGLAERRPGYVANVTFLEALLLLEVVAAAVWHYERWFFLIMMLTFLWAGTDLPLAGAGNRGRWVFLAVGALVGIVKWLQRDVRRHFTAIDLVALLCVISAAVSSLASSRVDRMEVSLLKSTSLLLIFLYAASGAKIAVVGRESKFFSGLLTACEVTSYLSALSYVVLHFEVFGNPNSLGAVMGVVVVPILLWGVLTTTDRHARFRRTIALCLGSYLLYLSVSRAGILACAVAVTVLCVALRRKLLFIKGAAVLMFLVAIVAVVQPARFDALVTAFTEDVIYKGKPETGLLGSRKSPWQDTVDVIKQDNNWYFGVGFGTGSEPQDVAEGLVFRTAGGSVREHGNSYLALLEYVGLLGIVPFVILVLMVMRQIALGCSLMWRTRDPGHYVVPLVLVCIAGLVHAFFEDWLFAVGFYLTVFFWTAAFVLAELQSGLTPASVMIHRAWRKIPVSAQVPLSPIR